ncbi:MAG: shikimate dehydrogenase family protein, partial [Candidatus Limnocylindria bacterium]
MTRRVALVGHGIGYSASPAMHNAAFASLGMGWRYELRDVPAGALTRVVGELAGGELQGLNVTQPHKETILPLLDAVTAEVERTGAVNTVVRRDGSLVGHNTDLPALAGELAALGHFRFALILGRGGAA